MHNVHLLGLNDRLLLMQSSPTWTSNFRQNSALSAQSKLGYS